MELKNIFKMVKANRYTQDGRDAIAKETAIMEALNLSTGEDNNLHKMSDETIERLYARTQEKPAAGKTTIRQGPNTKTLNETPAEHIKKNLDAYTGNSAYDMEELVLKPSGYKRQTNARIPSGGQSVTYTKEGEEDITLFFDKDGELENADVSAGSKPDAAESKPTGSSREARVDEYWSKIRKETQPVARMAAELDRGTFDDDVINTMGDGQSMEDLARSLISPAFEEDGYIPQDKLDTARKIIRKRYRALESEATGDAAPKIRQLTGDTKIRIRK